MWFCNLQVFFLFSMYFWFCGSFSGTGWMLKLPNVILWYYQKKKLFIKPFTLCWESREKQSPTSVFSRSDNIHLFVLRFFLMCTIYWICYSFVAPILCFGFFGLEACGILVPWPGIEPPPPALEGEVLTTGLPGKSQYSLSPPCPQQSVVESDW